MKKLIALIFILGILVLASQGSTLQVQPSPIPTPTPSFQPIVKSEGDVTVTVRAIVLAVGENPVFEVTMDTHNVILDFNIAAVAKLTDALGKTYGTPEWNGTDPGGHHQKGTLTFPIPLTKLSEKVELTFRDIDNIPVRTFMAEPQ